MRLILLPLMLFVATAAARAAPADAIELPSEFVHDQVWLVPEVDGQPLRFFTDTGGGFNAVREDVARRLGLAIELGEGDGGRPIALAPYPRFDPGRSLPAPPPYFMGGRMMVVDAAQLQGKEGFLGGRWFADGVWEFDYGAGRLRKLRGPSRAPAADAVPLGFQRNANGQRTMHFPSMPIVVDGETLEVLLDTGATAILTDASAPRFGLPAGTAVGTSFIEREVFDRWVSRHPDWAVIVGGDRIGEHSFRMIRVPQVTVGRHVVGPVWFAERAPGAFQRYMAGMMDKPTWGALGGSGLKYFRMTVDYPAATAWFTPVAGRE